MDVESLARLQFAVTISFHYIYPPLSIGLGVLIVIMEGLFLKTKKPEYEKLTKFWIKIFALIFAMGVATGIVMEFEFGTNWATYSRYVGDIFGSALAAEGIFAFFLESGFLAILVFGWNKVGPKVHFISTVMVSLGSMLSAVWIVVANSWQQTPAGFQIVGKGLNTRAEVTDFWQMIFNPSSIERLLHVLSGAWLAGAFFVLSVSAYYLIKKRHTELSQKAIKIALSLAIFASLFQLLSGHRSAVGVSENQQAKLAAYEAHFDSLSSAPMYLFGWVNEDQQEVKFGIAIPKLLSILISGDPDYPVKGLNYFPPEDRPPVNIIFQSYHFMVAIGFALIAISVLGIYFWWRKSLFGKKWFLYILVFSVLLPQIANQLGWISAEVGRQPWIVYGLLRTSDALSKVVEGNQVLFSLILFTIIYLLLFILFLYLLNEKIQKGPEEIEESSMVYGQQKQVIGSD